jgi:hypothetical protein
MLKYGQLSINSEYTIPFLHFVQQKAFMNKRVETDLLTINLSSM